jgi:hypothetical protein
MAGTQSKQEHEDEDVLSPSIKMIREYVQAYPLYVPKQLEELDPVRYKKIPETLRKRGKQEGGGSSLVKEEVMELVKWKLSHGKFRPNLMNLVSKNSGEVIQESTMKAFAEKDTVKALDLLTKLSGIGPATASLLLSVNNPEAVPFFSDEMFRFSQLSRDRHGGLSGWDRKIGYNKKEYVGLLAFYTELLQIINKEAKSGSKINMLDIEKYAYVLHAKRGEEGGEGKGEGSKERTKRSRSDSTTKGEEKPTQENDHDEAQGRPKRTRVQTKSHK